jgi:hypothetical protein
MNDTPDLPDTSDLPDVPDVPDVPGVSDTSDLPDVPDAPDAMDTYDIPDRTSEIAAVHSKVFGEAHSAPLVVATAGHDNGHEDGHGHRPHLSDGEIVDRASRAENGSKFQELMSGSWENHYASQSEADLGLASTLAFWTDDPVQMLRIIRGSALWDEKWERTDYQERTLGKALRSVRDYYKGPGGLGGHGQPAPPTGHIPHRHPDDNDVPEPTDKSVTTDPPPGNEAVKNGKLRTMGWQAKALSELSAVGARVPFLLRGYLAVAMITLYTALWKSGKTTFIAHLLKAGDGSETFFCGEPIEPIKALVISEESETKWAERRDDLGLGDHVHVICRPFPMRPTTPDWGVFMHDIAQLVKERGFNLVIFDTVQNLWCVKDENDAAQVIEALVPLNMITKEGAAVLLAMHPSKSDATEGRMTRGSGAIGGFVDIIVEMRRFDPERRDDSRRVLTAYSRFDDTPTQKVIELDKDNQQYRAVGTKADAKSADRLSVIQQILEDSNGNHLTPEDIYLKWEGTDAGVARPSIRTLRRDLEGAMEDDPNTVIRQSGSGRKKAPFRYYIIK